MIIFRKRVTQILEERGLKQAWLATKANTTEATISRYLKGKQESPKVETVVSIAEALDVSTDYLLGLSECPKTNFTENEKILINAIRKATERDQQLIWSIAETYLTASEKVVHSKLSERRARIG